MKQPTFSKRIFPVLCFLMIFTGWDLGNQLSHKTHEANNLYEQENYEEALKKYTEAQLESPESPQLYFNIGNVLYQQQKYEDAVTEYQKALSTDDVMQQSQVYYNTGNCHFKTGKLDEAIFSYIKALELNPDDEDAKYNLELARRLLKEMAQKQQKEQQQQQQQQSSQQEQKQEEGEQQQQQDSAGNEQEEQSADSKEEQAADKQDEDQGTPQPVPQEQQDGKSMTEEEAMRLLRALEESEKEYQKKQRQFSIPKGSQPRYDW